MATAKVRPTKLELAILRILWQRGSATVREIHGALNEAKPTGYTTALKMLQIMTDKGLVERDESTRPQIYRARHTQSRTQQHLLTDLMQRAFGGSVKALVMQALASKKSSREDLETIRKMLEKMEEESR
jgi:BlaI family transcriptional regulator, penicillinase repressor